MIVLDTNVLSALMRPAVPSELEAWLLTVTDDVLCTTAVTVMEIVHGLERLPSGRRRRELEARFDALVHPQDGLQVLAFEGASARLAALYRARRDALGRPSSGADMMIAGICGVAQASLATRNLRDFEGLPLTVIDPFGGR